MKVVRLTQHTAQDAQVAELRRLFGENVEILQVSQTLDRDMKTAVAQFDDIAANAEVVEVVLPVALLEAILKFSTAVERGTMLIRAAGLERSIGADGRATFVFGADAFYERVVRVEVVTVRL